MKKVYVIGAGPAGLTAAYELLKQSKEYEVVVLEENDAMGGIWRASGAFTATPWPIPERS